MVEAVKNKTIKVTLNEKVILQATSSYKDHAFIWTVNQGHEFVTITPSPDGLFCDFVASQAGSVDITVLDTVTNAVHEMLISVSDPADKHLSTKIDVKVVKEADKVAFYKKEADKAAAAKK
jgi:hypothetical protein